jgi:hypothetical protein
MDGPAKRLRGFGWGHCCASRLGCADHKRPTANDRAIEGADRSRGLVARRQRHEGVSAGESCSSVNRDVDFAGHQVMASK